MWSGDGAVEQQFDGGKVSSLGADITGIIDAIALYGLEEPIVYYEDNIFNSNRLIRLKMLLIYDDSSGFESWLHSRATRRFPELE